MLPKETEKGIAQIGTSRRKSPLTENWVRGLLFMPKSNPANIGSCCPSGCLWQRNHKSCWVSLYVSNRPLDGEGGTALTENLPAWG